ncbi:hypothetical protein R1sor_009191 [Riccia sorocarpa]|uniref:Reverse transcriptase domain-containing protein n=1 Tax=Riccia sorocarpa TaxID=122646 RepID=A0ABD3H7T1_9MARC
MLTGQQIKLVSWNVRGITNPDKARAVKRWLKRRLGEADVVALQGLKSNSWCSNRWLRSIKKKGTVIMDKPVGSKGGTALVLQEKIQVIASGVSGFGRLAWAKTKIGELEVGLVSLHAPNKRRQRVAFWAQVKEIIKEGSWVVFGDFNQVEVAEDSRGRSAILRDEPTETRRWESYFKMDAFELKDEEVMRRVQEAWWGEQEIVRDDRRRWLRGWQHVKRVLKEVRNEKTQQRKAEGDLEAEVALRRSLITEEVSQRELDALERVEKRLKERELRDARAWRLRSREKWLTIDETPTRYFCTKLRAKWANERLDALELEDGEITTDDEEMLGEIHTFYQELYTEVPESVEKAAAREAVVCLMTKRISTTVSRRLTEVPSWDEIEGVVFRMKTNKAPGHDGLTVEMVRECWDMVGEDCVNMVKAVWVKKKILRTDSQGVIKLLAKGGDRKRLANWRPISLMTLSYKIVTKIVANRIRQVIPELVDQQQSGFVKDRQISDNILCFKMAQEWASWMGQKGVFAKLDFVKAYDHIDHMFLWRCIEQLGFDRQFISLLQGVPLAPLLYAICTQPFMELLKKAEKEGRLKGLRIAPGKSLLFQLFADDTGVFLEESEENFEELKKILDLYGRASGAKVNINACLLMPLGSTTIPDWVRRVGCDVAEEGKVFKYLGICAGVGVQVNTSIDALTGNQLPGHLHISSLKRVWRCMGNDEGKIWQIIEGAARRREVCTVRELVREGRRVDTQKLDGILEEGLRRTEEVDSEVDFLGAKGFVLVHRLPQPVPNIVGRPPIVDIRINVDIYPQKVQAVPLHFRYNARDTKGCRRKATPSQECLNRVHSALTSVMMLNGTWDIHEGNGCGKMFRVSTHLHADVKNYIVQLCCFPTCSCQDFFERET